MKAKFKDYLLHQLIENTDNEQRDPHTLTEKLQSGTTTANAWWCVLSRAASSSMSFLNVSTINILGPIILCCVRLSRALLDI